MILDDVYAANSPARLATLIFMIFYLAFLYWNAYRVFKFIQTSDSKQSDKLIFGAIISLMTGDTIHEIYLIISYAKNDVWMNGAGFYWLMLTSLLMSGYYLFLLFFQHKEYPKPENQKIYLVLYVLFFIRIIFGVLPENKYTDPSVETYTAIRYISNGFFCLFGLIVLGLFYKNVMASDPKSEKKYPALFKKSFIWGYLSFLFFILHISLYPINTMFGMFMIPKSIAYLVEVYYLVEGIMLLRKESKN
jgi:hypothetical protein